MPPPAPATKATFPEKLIFTSRRARLSTVAHPAIIQAPVHQSPRDMQHILLAILPVFLVIATGALAKRFGFPGAGFWVPAERLTYYLLFPALIVATLARAELGGLALGPMAAALVAGPLVATPILLALRPVSGLSGPAFTSVFQGAIRFNTYIGLAVAFDLRGVAGVAAAAVAIAVLAVFGNLLSVTVLAAYGGAGRPGPLVIVKQVIGNPLILAAPWPWGCWR
jgi:predicted permease